MIRNATLKDAKAITDIYNYYVKNSIATFDEVEVSVAVFSDKINSVTQKYPWVVFEIDNEIVGYCYASSWHPRSAYKTSAEISVYLKHKATANGIGSKLYQHVIGELKKMKIHAVIGGISLPNEASVRLHEKFGFKQVAHYKEIGQKFNKWIDVGYWQRIL